MLSSGIMQRAFVEAIVLGIACGPLGVWILLLRRAYAAESLSHAMLPGLVIASLAGIPLLLGAAGGGGWESSLDDPDREALQPL